jgi:hypothetical protein
MNGPNPLLASRLLRLRRRFVRKGSAFPKDSPSLLQGDALQAADRQTIWWFSTPRRNMRCGPRGATMKGGVWWFTRTVS